MLGISGKKKQNIDLKSSNFGAWRQITNPRTARILAYWIIGVLMFMVGFMFVPWTQNIRSTGKLTTLTPEDRPQNIQSRIDGRVEHWYVKEGDTLKTGDTIVFISEIKDQYFDPELLKRTREQLDAKESAGMAYQGKIQALESQMATERRNLALRFKMAQNRVQIASRRVSIDSADVDAARIQYDIAKDQLLRGETMYAEQGIMSLRDLEARRNRAQESLAKLVAAENRLANTRQELLNATIDLNGVEADFLAKIFKIESEIGSARSELFKTDDEIAKMTNVYANYSIRSRYWYITAPRDCQIVRIMKSGIGENVNVGEPVATITSLHPNLAVELYIRPVDIPLIHLGTKVRLFFDGWPTIIFSGWPGVSYGTFGAIVAAIDSDISQNGLYRILVSPDPNDEPWPEQLRVGAGARGFALLNTVPIWYELWRQLNGFPPDFYTIVDVDMGVGKHKKEQDKKEKK
jgi:multidrug resistance efflux pump